MSLLTPDDIEHQVFKEKFRGYDPDEVDGFLDRVTATVAALRSERDDALRRLEELRESTAGSSEAEEMLKRTLISAQRVADATIEESKAEAASRLGEAEDEARHVTEAAQEEAERVLADARARADEVLAEARLTSAREREEARLGIEHLRRVVADLERFRTEYRDRFHAIVAEQTAVLERIGEFPELPEHITELASVADVARLGVGAHRDAAPFGERRTAEDRLAEDRLAEDRLAEDRLAEDRLAEDRLAEERGEER